MPALC